jgi:flavin-dependent dehydrogenase
LKKAIDAGVCFKVATVRRIVAGVDDEARLSTTAGADSADFVIGAYGHNPGLTRGIATPEGQGLDSPTTQTSTVLEFSFGKDFCQRVYGDLVHVVILPKQLYPNMTIWFAAFVPKQEGSVTVVLMGRRDVSRQDVQAFFATAPARELLPDLPPAKAQTLTTAVTSRGGPQCKCTKNTITVSPPPALPPLERRIALSGRRRADATIQEQARIGN